MLDGQVFGNVVDHSTTNSEIGGSRFESSRSLVPENLSAKTLEEYTFSFPDLRGSGEKILLYQNESKCVEK